MCYSTPGVGVLFYSIPLPFNSNGLLPFTSNGLKGFWFCFLARKILGLLARSSGSFPGVGDSKAPSEEF